MCSRIVKSSLCERQLSEVKHMKSVQGKVKPIEWLSKSKKKLNTKETFVSKSVKNMPLHLDIRSEPVNFNTLSRK